MGRPVHCYVYDLTQGMAKTLSRAILGQEIEGVWHASIVVGGNEYFYGYGIQQAVAGRTPFGRPLKVVDLGETEVPDVMIQDLLNDLTPRYKPQDYSFLWHNCTHFCDELSLLLTGNQVPEYLTGQGTLVLEHPFLRNMLPMFEQMETVTGSATATGFAGAAGNPAQASMPVQQASSTAVSGPGSAHTAALPAAGAGAARVNGGAASSCIAVQARSAPNNASAAGASMDGAVAQDGGAPSVPAQPAAPSPSISAAGAAAAARAAAAAAAGTGSVAANADDGAQENGKIGKAMPTLPPQRKGTGSSPVKEASKMAGQTAISNGNVSQ